MSGPYSRPIISTTPASEGPSTLFPSSRMGASSAYTAALSSSSSAAPPYNPNTASSSSSSSYSAAPPYNPNTASSSSSSSSSSLLNAITSGLAGIHIGPRSAVASETMAGRLTLKRECVIIPVFKDTGSTILDPITVRILTLAIDLMISVFSFESIITSGTTLLPPSAEIKLEEKIQLVFGNSNTAFTNKGPAETFCVVDYVKYTDTTTGIEYPNTILGASVLVRETSGLMSLWSVASNPYYTGVKTVECMINGIHDYIAARKSLPKRLVLQVSDIPYPFVTLDERLAIYGKAGFKLFKPSSGSLFKRAYEADLADSRLIAIRNVDGASVSIGIPEYNGTDSIPPIPISDFCCYRSQGNLPLLMITEIASMVLDTIPPAIPTRSPYLPPIPKQNVLFSVNHSMYHVNTATSTIEFTNTGPCQVAIFAMPTSVTFFNVFRPAVNFINKLVVTYPIELLVKIFEGIKPDRGSPNNLKIGSLNSAGQPYINTNFSKNVYGGVVINFRVNVTETSAENQMMTLYLYPPGTPIPDMKLEYTNYNTRSADPFSIMGLFKGYDTHGNLNKYKSHAELPQDEEGSRIQSYLDSIRQRFDETATGTITQEIKDKYLESVVHSIYLERGVFNQSSSMRRFDLLDDMGVTDSKIILLSKVLENIGKKHSGARSHISFLSCGPLATEGENTPEEIRDNGIINTHIAELHPYATVVEGVTNTVGGIASEFFNRLERAVEALYRRVEPIISNTEILQQTGKGRRTRKRKQYSRRKSTRRRQRKQRK